MAFFSCLRIRRAKVRQPVERRQPMNVAKTAVYLLLLLLVTVMVPGHVWGQSDAQGTKLRRVVPPDTETMVSSASQWCYREGEGQRQCSPNGIPALELVTQPQHGTVRFVYADLGHPKRVGVHKLGVRTGGHVSTGPRVRRQGSVYLQRSA